MRLFWAVMTTINVNSITSSNHVTHWTGLICLTFTLLLIVSAEDEA